jgi:hypothetical protein
MMLLVRNRKNLKIQNSVELAELLVGLGDNSTQIQRNSVTCFINAAHFCIFDSI